MATETLEREDVQGLVMRGYGSLPLARYDVGTIIDPARARAWLRGLRADTGLGRPAGTAVNVAFTAPGLAKLRVPGRALEQFSREFLDGMTAEHRQRILGDTGESAPQHWAWGAPDGDDVDVVLLAYADGDAALAAIAAPGEADGIRPVATLDTIPLVPYEHFGFRDGISQPRLALEDGAPGPARDAVATGEFVLGYRNEYGRLTPRPLLEPADDPDGLLPGGDLGRNGSYLVLRTLRQDVEGFHAFCARAAGDGAARLEARMVGRWPSGAPLVLAPDADGPVADLNDFAYHATDPLGLRCPIGAHVRRANPRDTLDPAPGTERSVAVNKRHRLLRRGRSYGTEADAERGLHFVCLAGNLSRQFEFVQHSWLNDPRFNGLYDEPDPLGAPEPPGGRTFSVPGAPVRERYTALPRFVSVRGGAYFFLPGLRALRHVATLGGRETG